MRDSDDMSVMVVLVLIRWISGGLTERLLYSAFFEAEIKLTMRKESNKERGTRLGCHL